MFIKIAGAVSVIAAATLLGLEMSRTLKRRVETIDGFISSLQYMESAIDFTLSPIDEIIETLSKEQKGETGQFFKALKNGSQDVQPVEAGNGYAWTGLLSGLNGIWTGSLSGTYPVSTDDFSGEFHEKWNTCLSRIKGLTKDDKAVIAELSTHIGNSGKDAQLATLRLCRDRLKSRLESAKNDFQANGKMLKGLGFFGGILITITLF